MIGNLGASRFRRSDFGPMIREGYKIIARHWAEAAAAAAAALANVEGVRC